MKRKHRIRVSILALAVSGVVAGTAAAHAPQATLTIRHQVRGCHAWAIGTGAYKAAQSVTLSRGTTIRFTNNDVMAHRLVQLSGPRVQMFNIRSSMPMSMGGKWPFAAGMMGNMGAGTKITFARVGTYTFTTKAGEDYMQGMKTIGEDNVLRLTVTVK